MHVSASSPCFLELMLLNTHCQNFSALGLLAKQTENSYNSLIKTDSWRPFFIPDADSLINEIKFLFLSINEILDRPRHLAMASPRTGESRKLFNYRTYPLG